MNRTDPIVDLIPYLITNRGTANTPLFRDPSDYRRFLKTLATAAKQHQVRVLARMLLPTEFRLILEQLPGGSIPRTMHSVETSTAMRFNLRYERIYTVNQLATVLESFRRPSAKASDIDFDEWVWIHSAISRTLSHALQRSSHCPPEPATLS